MQPPENPYGAPLPDPSGRSNFPMQSGGVNNSGQGPLSTLPPELQGVNVGAFFLNWIWAIAHNYWLGLLCFVPCVGFAMQIYMLIKGNEIAWQSRRWDSIEQFKEVQKKWMIWGIAITVFFCICYGGLSVVGAGMGAMNPNNLR